MANSRLSNRATFFAEVDVLSMGEAMPQRLWGQNLSEAGIFLQTTKPFHPGDRVSLRFDISESEVHVRAAEVVWVKPFEPINVGGELPGIGVRFLSVEPPARAAIRRYVTCASGTPLATVAIDSDVPAPPREPELSEGEYMSLASLKPLSLPPFESSQPASLQASTLPPDEPLPSETPTDEPPAGADTEHPLTGWRFEVQKEPQQPATNVSPAWEDATPAVGQPSLPPDASLSLDDVHDTLPPFAVSLPPFELSGEEARWNLPSMPPEVADQLAADHPAAATAAVDAEGPPHDIMEVAKPPAIGETQPYGLSIPDEGALPAPSLSLTFDDDEPGAGAKPALMPAPVTRARPPQPAPRTELPAEVFTATLPPPKEERGPDVFELAAHERVDNEFFEGKLSVLELPQAERRGHDARATRRLRVAWAAGLLLAGGGLGVWMGYEPAPNVASSSTVEHREVTTLLAPKPVAEAEKELFAATPSKATPPPASSSASSSAPAVAATPPAETATIPIVSPDEIATSKAGSLPRKQDVSLTSSREVAAPTPPPTPTLSSSGTKVEYGRVTVPLEGGRVARSFALSNPSRVVVDLVDATMPRAKVDEVGEKGVTRVRYGRPDPLHVRVVVELAGASPKDITTLKKGSSLSVAWR